MRLIDAEELERLFNEQVEHGATDLFDAFDDALQDAQTVDAAPVVHCGECRYYIAGMSAVRVCCHPGGMKFTSDSDYCGRGEHCSNQSADVRKMEDIPDAAKETT